jgi:predicted nucleic acid-binding protein
LVYYECTNVIWKAVRRGLSSHSGALTALGDLLSMSIQAVDVTQLAPTALSIALAHNHPVYDCYYVAAAIKNDAALATADERLYDLALRVGLGERAILVR